VRYIMKIYKIILVIFFAKSALHSFEDLYIAPVIERDTLDAFQAKYSEASAITLFQFVAEEEDMDIKKECSLNLKIQDLENKLKIKSRNVNDFLIQFPELMVLYRKKFNLQKARYCASYILGTKQRHQWPDNVINQAKMIAQDCNNMFRFYA
jgi:hypothetical protein